MKNTINTNLNELIMSAQATLSSWCDKYSYTDDDAKSLISALEMEFTNSPESAAKLVKNMPFYLFKFLWPHLSETLSSKIFDEVPVLAFLYLPEIQDTGKPTLKQIRSEVEMHNILTNISDSRLGREALSYYLKYAEQQSVLMIWNQFVKFPKIAQQLMLVIEDGFGPESPSQETFSILLNNMIKQCNPDIILPYPPLVNPEKQELLRQLDDTLHVVMPHQVKQLNFDELRKKNYKFKGFLGRTLLFYQENDSEKLLAVKISKYKSEGDLLAQECETVKCLNQNQQEFKLKSTLPQPWKSGMYEIDHDQLTDWLSRIKDHDQSNFNQLVNHQSKYVAYTYEAPPGYFTYLTDIKQDKEFKEAVVKSMHDLATMFTDYGIIFHQLVPLFHAVPEERDRADGGKYMVLANVVQNTGSYRLLEKTHPGNLGTGRLPGYEKAVEHANLRAIGFADLGDRESITNLKKVIGAAWYQAMQSGDDARVKKGWGDQVDLALTANFLAEYIFIVGIIAGVRNRKLDRTSEENKEDWLNSAETIMNAAKVAITSATNFTEVEIDNFLNSTINKERLARQMQFFMTDEYVKYIDQNLPFPDDLYDSRTKTTIQHQKVKDLPSWKKGQELAVTKDGADLGTPFASIPLTELLNLSHLVPFVILLDKQQQINKFPVNIDLKERYSKLLGHKQGQEKINIDTPNSIIPKIAKPLWSKEDIATQLNLVEDSYYHVKTLLKTVSQEQLPTLLQNPIVQDALIKVIHFSRYSRFPYVKVYKVLKVLPAENIWEVLSNPKFENDLSSVMSEFPLWALSTFYQILSPHDKDKLFELSYVNTILKEDANIIYDQRGLYALLEKLPKNKRLEFLTKYELPKRIFDGFFQRRVDTKDCYFLFNRVLAKLIPENDRLAVLEMMDLHRVSEILQRIEGNKGAILEHLVKILPKTDRKKLLFSSTFEKVIANVAETAPHYIDQIVQLLPPVQKELFKIKMSIRKEDRFTKRPQGSQVNFSPKRSKVGRTILQPN